MSEKYENLFDLAKRMASALRETRDGGPSFKTALDLCVEFDGVDAEHDSAEWKRIHEPGLTELESLAEAQGVKPVTDISSLAMEGIDSGFMEAATSDERVADAFARALLSRPEFVGDERALREAIRAAAILLRPDDPEGRTASWEIDRVVWNKAHGRTALSTTRPEPTKQDMADAIAETIAAHGYLANAEDAPRVAHVIRVALTAAKEVKP
jgi:hypothetical protein